MHGGISLCAFVDGHISEKGQVAVIVMLANAHDVSLMWALFTAVFTLG